MRQWEEAKTKYSVNKTLPEKPMESTQSLHTVDDTEFFIVRQNSRRCTEFEPCDQASSKLLGKF